MHLVLEPSTWSSGGDPVKVEVHLAASGRRMVKSGIHLSFAPGCGQIDEPIETAPGDYVARWRPPARLPGSKTTVAVSAGSLVRSATLTLRTGPIARIEVTPDRNSLRANGRNETRVRVLALDSGGNPATSDRLQAGTDPGSLGPLAQADGGAWVAAYVPPRMHQYGTGTVAVRGDGTETAARHGCQNGRPAVPGAVPASTARGAF